MTTRKILVLAEGQLGDLLLLTPAIRALRNGHPDARITVLIFHRHRTSSPGPAPLLFPSDGSGTAAVMTSHPCVDEVLEVDRSALRGLGGLKRLSGEVFLVRQIRKRRFDSVVCTFPEDRFTMLAFLSGAQTRVGQKRQALSRFLNVTPAISKKTIGVLAYYNALAEHSGGHVRSSRTEFYISPGAERTSAARLREEGRLNGPWVAVHPGASGDYKVWPPERYAALINGLHAKQIPVLLFGGGADDTILGAVLEHVSAPVTTIRTGNDVTLLAAYLRRAALCITNDSGPRHLAVAVGTPSLALFRQFHGKEWAVYPESAVCATLTGSSVCAACPASVCLDRVPPGKRYGSTCLREITADEVMARALTMLATSSAGTRRTSSDDTGQSVTA